MRKQGPAHLRRNLRTTRTAAAGGRGQKRQHSPAAPKPAGAQGETTHKAKGPCAWKSSLCPAASRPLRRPSRAGLVARQPATSVSSRLPYVVARHGLGLSAGFRWPDTCGESRPQSRSVRPGRRAAQRRAAEKKRGPVNDFRAARHPGSRESATFASTNHNAKIILFNLETKQISILIITF